MITKASSRVITFVARQLISTTLPMWAGLVSYWIQSPSSNGCSAWMASPAKTLPSVSLRANPSTAVRTADPVNRFSARTPASKRMAISAATTVSSRSTSRKIRGMGRLIRSHADTTTISSTDCRSDASRKKRMPRAAILGASKESGNSHATASGNGASSSRVIGPHASHRRPRGAEKTKSTSATSATISSRPSSWSPPLFGMLKNPLRTLSSMRAGAPSGCRLMLRVRQIVPGLGAADKPRNRGIPRDFAISLMPDRRRGGLFLYSGARGKVRGYFHFPARDDPEYVWSN